MDKKYTFISNCYKLVDKLNRYRHHIVFLSTYLKLNSVPKGFALKFHNNIAEVDFASVLKNCSKKLMEKTVSTYRNKLSACKLFIQKELKECKLQIPVDYEFVFEKVVQKSQKLMNILKARRTNKFERDAVDVNKAEEISLSILQKYEPLFSSQAITTAEILDGVVLPDYKPVNLHKDGIALSDSFTSLCCKGPSFVPTPIYFDWLQLQRDFDSFRNALRRKHFFSKHPSTYIPDASKPKIKSNWIAPKSSSPELETFLNLVERELFSDTSRKRIADNLTSEERKALNDWRKDCLFNENSDDVIRLQDKGKRFIYVDKATDMSKTQDQIVKSNFISVPDDLTKQHINKVESWAEKWHKKGEICDDWMKYIVNFDAVPGKNTPLYKTHKEGIPVRLLTTGCNTAIEKLSIFVEKICSPLAIANETQIKDTSHLLCMIDDLNEKGIPTNTLFVSFDIVNMFPSIDNTIGIETVRCVLDNRPKKKPSTKCIIEALTICLYNNNSSFAGNHLLQSNGTAMGAPNSCSYSDIALQPIDNRVMEAKVETFAELLFFGRFRDDCLALWTGGLIKLNEFFLFLNTLDLHLKFTMEVGKLNFKADEFSDFINNPSSDLVSLKQSAQKEITFLDVHIYLENNKIETTVYSKPTDSHLFLHGKSCHKKSSITGIQKGVALRLRRICSTNKEYENKSKQYKAFLINRGHDSGQVVKIFTKVDSLSRAEARQKSTKTFSTDCVMFPTEFNPHGPNIKTILNKHLHLLQNTPTLKNIFPEDCIKTTSKRGSNLKELLTRADPYSIKPDVMNSALGYVKCGRKCDSCNEFVREGNSIKCNATGRIFKIRRDSNCNTKNVIYVAHCKACNFQGVGSTTSWKPRLSNYKSHIKNKISTCNIVQHFLNGCRGEEHTPYSNLFFKIVDCLNNVERLSSEEIDDLLLNKEKFWIGSLLTQHRGMNGTHDWNRSKRWDKKQ